MLTFSAGSRLNLFEIFYSSSATPIFFKIRDQKSTARGSHVVFMSFGLFIWSIYAQSYQIEKGKVVFLAIQKNE